MFGDIFHDEPGKGSIVNLADMAHIALAYRHKLFGEAYNRGGSKLGGGVFLYGIWETFANCNFMCFNSPAFECSRSDLFDGIERHGLMTALGCPKAKEIADLEYDLIFAV